MKSAERIRNRRNSIFPRLQFRIFCYFPLFRHLFFSFGVHQTRANNPANNQQNIAPTTLIENPHSIIFRNNIFASLASLIVAMHSAPNVDRGETSTNDEPTLMLSAIASESPPPICSTNFVAVGKNAGSTTPEVLLYVETIPVKKAITPLILFGEAMRASNAVN